MPITPPTSSLCSLGDTNHNPDPNLYVVCRESAVAAMARYADSGYTTFDLADIYGPAEVISTSPPTFLSTYLATLITRRIALRTLTVYRRHPQITPPHCTS